NESAAVYSSYRLPESRDRYRAGHGSPLRPSSGRVLLPDGQSLGHELVRAGLTWWYRQHEPYDTTLPQLEAEARTTKYGLWADAHPRLPWEWQQDVVSPSPH